MKRKLSPILGMALALSLAACGDTDDESSSKGSEKAESSSVAETTVTEESSSVTQTETTTTTTTAAQTTTTTEATTEQPAPEVKTADFTNILGEWYIDGDAAAAHLDIRADGSFDSYYASGSLEYTGEIKYLKADLDDGAGENYYFCFFMDSETPLFYLLDEGKELEEFTTQGPSLLHFARLKENSKAEEAAFVMPENMPYNYYTTFGAGATSGIDLHINEDGTFEGLYLSYEALGGDKVDIKYSHFAGTLKNAGKDQGGFDMFEITQIKGVPGKPKKSSYFAGYVDETMTDVTKSYGSIGIPEGEKLHLYFQGTDISELPGDFTNHIGGFNESDDVLTEIFLFGEKSISIFVSQ